jgi:polyvinyl alcohol dehydrogenase (cytochrome)
MNAKVLCALCVVWAAASASAQDGAALYAQQCASCHEGGAVSRAPGRDVIAALPADRIVASLETGTMRVQGETLTAAQKRAVATFLSTARSTATTAPTARPRCEASAFDAGASPAPWNGWGVTLANDRFQRRPGITAEQIPALKLKWAFGFEGENAAAAQPTVVGGRVFVGSASGRVYSLGLRDGCLHWTFKADAGVRGAVIVEGTTAYFGDLRATVYGVDIASGELRWKKKIEDHRSARITGSLVLYNRRLYVPVSSGEEGIGGQPTYECCTFRGSVVALDPATGDQVWKAYMIGEQPKPQAKNARGTQMWGPSGAGVWSAPTIDPVTRSLYVGTGDSYSQPAAPTSDAIVALDLDTGAIKWVQQTTAGDAFNMACMSADLTNCPEKAGPDHDFGQSPILVPLGGGSRVLVAGQKSAVVYGFDPDNGGKKLWSTTIGRGGELGGIEWGSAADGEHVYVPLSDFTFRDPKMLGRGGIDARVGGGLFAIRVTDGKQVWVARPNACGEKSSCSPALSAPSAVIPGAVLSGSVDGHFRAFSTKDGKVLWDFDTAREFDTANGVNARGGSIDVGGPAIAEGVVLTTSGYGTWGGMRGNVLLAFSVEGR